MTCRHPLPTAASARQTASRRGTRTYRAKGGGR